MKPAAIKRVLVPYKYRDAKALARGYMYDMTQYCRDNVDKYLKALQLPVSSLRRAPTPFIDESRLPPAMTVPEDSDCEPGAASDSRGSRSTPCRAAPAPTKGGAPYTEPVTGSVRKGTTKKQGHGSGVRATSRRIPEALEPALNQM